MKLNIKFSEDYEIYRVKSTLGKIDWYKKQGYLINLPKLENDNPSDTDIEEAVKAEYNKNDFLVYSSYLENNWGAYSEALSKELSALAGVERLDEYNVNLTKYGTGGSYGQPNTVIINISQRKETDLLTTLAHEITHLSIEKLIAEYGIEHWPKERVVDLILSKIFPADYKMQKLPISVEDIDHSFRDFYPNIIEVVKNISKN